jgi:hypothetical protein
VTEARVSGGVISRIVWIAVSYWVFVPHGFSPSHTVSFRGAGFGHVRAEKQFLSVIAMHEQLRSYALPHFADESGPKLHSRRGEPHARGRSEEYEAGTDLDEIAIGFPALSTPLVGAIEDVIEKLDDFIDRNIHTARRMGFRQNAEPSGEVKELVEACRAAAKFFGDAFASRHEQPLVGAFGQVTDAVEANLAMFLLQFTDEDVAQGLSQDRLGEVVRIGILFRQQLRAGARQIEQIQGAVLLQLAGRKGEK